MAPALDVFTVSQVNTYIKNLFARDFALRQITVRGEVSNCKYHTSGHIYFTLKDGTGTLAAVMFAGNRPGLRFTLKEGQQVMVSGSISVYERSGSYQLYAKQIRLDGMGDLYLRMEELKNRLAEMGMFAPEYKQPIPRFAQKIGIVTASTGAAIRDIVNITHRRNPYVQLILYPAIVQGEYAVPSIIRGIETLDAMHLDCLIVGRGGGSIEDLWAFNEEAVARAIFDCRTPVISAVGHETDTTIADYVADLRAPTPSAAAELAVFDVRSLEEELRVSEYRLKKQMDSHLRQDRFRLMALSERLKRQTPRYYLDNLRQGVLARENRLEEIMQSTVSDRKQKLALASSRLEALSPLARMQSGYAFVTDESGRPVRSVQNVQIGDRWEITLRDGSVTASVTGSRKDLNSYG